MKNFNIIEIFNTNLYDDFNSNGELKKIFRLYDSYGKGLVEQIDIDENVSINIVKNATTLKNNYISECETNKSNFLKMYFCLSGSLDIINKTTNSIHRLKANDFVIFEINNKINSYIFKYKNLQAISININLENINSLRDLFTSKDFQNIIKVTKLLKYKKYFNTKIPEDINENIEYIHKFVVNNIKDYIKLNLITIDIINLINEFIIKNITGGLSHPDEQIIINIKQMILKDLENPPTVSEITDKYDISPYKLQKGFKALYDTTYYDYIINLRIKQSLPLLEKNETTILDIAQGLGFENPSKFSQYFKNIMDMTPSDYRNKHKKKKQP